MRLKSVAESMEGVLLVQKVYPNGDKETIFKKENVIVLSAKQKLVRSLYQNNGAEDFISNLKVGTGGTVDPEGLFPKEVNMSLTNLYSSLLSVPVTFIDNPSIPSVTFIADLDQGTGNGQILTEAGLFKSSGDMFNIKTFPGIPKTSEFGLHFEWTVTIR